MLNDRLRPGEPVGAIAAKIARAARIAAMPERLYFTDSDQANELIARDPMALLVGFVLDQQVSVQKAFSGPLELKRRLGSLDPRALADADLESVFQSKPAIHRFPGAMAGRVRALGRRRRARLDRRCQCRGAARQPDGTPGLRRDEGQIAGGGAGEALWCRGGARACAESPDARRC